MICKWGDEKTVIFLEALDRHFTICKINWENTKVWTMLTSMRGTIELQMHENVWDCLGDIMTQAMIDEKFKNNTVSRHELFLKGFLYFEPKYYSTDYLLISYIELRKRGWIVHMKNDNIFYLDCPEFDEFYQNSLVKSQNSAVAVKKKNYAHPIDSGIINILDNPVIKTIFGSAVDMLTDLNFGQIISTGLPVNAKTFPEIDTIIDHCVAVLGIKRPYVVVSSAIALNAYTIGSDEEPYIVLGSMLVRVMNPVELMFIIGHECGHIAMGHVVYHTVVSTASSFSNVIPIIGPAVYKTASLALTAWCRRSEITADRAGLLCCNDLEEAKKALLQIQSGLIDAGQIDIDNYIRNSKRYRRKSVLRRVGEFVQSHPPVPKRLEALDLFANSELYYSARNTNLPEGSISEQELTKSVEHLIAVLGGGIRVWI